MEHDFALLDDILTIKKAKRRIKRFLKTGGKQARVVDEGNNIFLYKVRHHEEEMRFKLDRLGRLRRVK